jgi:hypothetical protein
MIDSASSSLLSPSFEKCTIVPPSLRSWIYAISVHGVCCLIGLIIGILLYNKPTEKKKKRTCWTALGVGTLSAISVYKGRSFIESYSPNDEITFAGPLFASTFGFATFFKSFNVAFHTYPSGADSNLKTWLVWFILLPEPSFDKEKMSKINRKEFINNIFDFIIKIIGLFITLSILIQFPSPSYTIIKKISASSSGDDDWDDVSNAHWLLMTHIDGFFHLWLLYLFFSFCLDFTTITNSIALGGIRMELGFCHPLSKSRSFKKCWGSRWNKPVNELLKRTIYIPSRKNGFNKSISVVFTFFGSGLLHEYNFSIHNNNNYHPGEVTIFFLFMGLLMIGESWVWNRCIPRWIQTVINSLPSIVVASGLTFVAAGLSERYFLRGWIVSGFIDMVAEMIPHMSCK